MFLLEINRTGHRNGIVSMQNWGVGSAVLIPYLYLWWSSIKLRTVEGLWVIDFLGYGLRQFVAGQIRQKLWEKTKKEFGGMIQKAKKEVSI